MNTRDETNVQAGECLGKCGYKGHTRITTEQDKGHTRITTEQDKGHTRITTE